MVHKLKISCGMMLGVYMRGVIRLMSKNPAAAPFWHFHFTLCYLSLSHTLLASSSVLVCLCMVYFLGFFSGIFCECVSRICSRNSIIITVWIVIGPSSCSIATAMAWSTCHIFLFLFVFADFRFWKVAMTSSMLSAESLLVSSSTAAMILLIFLSRRLFVWWSWSSTYHLRSWLSDRVEPRLFGFLWVGLLGIVASWKIALHCWLSRFCIWWR